MVVNDILNQLCKNLDTFQSILHHFSEETEAWKPNATQWSAREIICHLRDEEKWDFPRRIRFILNGETGTMPSIDPAAWVTQYEYASTPLATGFDAFKHLRLDHLYWLENDAPPHWENTYDHPKLGTISAHYFLENWAAHDLLHIKQLLHVLWNITATQAKNPLTYAGTWN